MASAMLKGSIMASLQRFCLLKSSICSSRKNALSCSAELTASRQRLSPTASARALRNSPPSLTMATFKNLPLSIHFPPSRKYSPIPTGMDSSRDCFRSMDIFMPSILSLTNSSIIFLLAPLAAIAAERQRPCKNLSRFSSTRIRCLSRIYLGMAAFIGAAYGLPHVERRFATPAMSFCWFSSFSAGSSISPAGISTDMLSSGGIPPCLALNMVFKL